MSKVDNFSKDELQEMVNNSFSFRELCKKIGYTPTGNNNETIRNKLHEYNIDYSHFSLAGRNKIERNEENVFCVGSTASQKVLRYWYEKGKYTEYKCSICGLEPFWNGKPLTMTLDHINGINNDDRLENLRWVCPNCDRQLDTFAGKNQIQPIKYNYCIDCGAPISPTSTRCKQCACKEIAKLRQTVERPPPRRI